MFELFDCKNCGENVSICKLLCRCQISDGWLMLLELELHRDEPTIFSETILFFSTNVCTSVNHNSLLERKKPICHIYDKIYLLEF